MSHSLTSLIGYIYICGGVLNGPLNYALIKQSLIRADKKSGNLAAIWKTCLSVTERWERGIAEPQVNPGEGGKGRERKTARLRKTETRNKGETMWGKGWGGVDLDIAKDRGPAFVTPTQGQLERAVFDSCGGNSNCHVHHLSVFQTGTNAHTRCCSAGYLKRHSNWSMLS